MDLMIRRFFKYLFKNSLKNVDAILSVAFICSPFIQFRLFQLGLEPELNNLVRALPYTQENIRKYKKI